MTDATEAFRSVDLQRPFNGDELPHARPAPAVGALLDQPFTIAFQTVVRPSPVGAIRLARRGNAILHPGGKRLADVVQRQIRHCGLRGVQTSAPSSIIA
jgi:hypothetical protein